jgi:hypothetical protein
MSIYLGNNGIGKEYAGGYQIGRVYLGTNLIQGEPYVPSGPVLPPVTSGLGLYLTTYEAASYPGSGSTWNDLSGNGYNFTLTNPDFYSDGGFNWFYFANDGGTKRYALNTADFTSGMPSALNQFGQKGTYFYVVKKNADKNFGLFSCLGSISNSGGGNNDYSNYQRHSIANSGIWVNRMYYIGAAPETNTTNFNNGDAHIAVARWDSSASGLWDLYVDDTSTGASTGNTNGTFDETTVRRVAFGINANLNDDPLDGDVAEVIWYNRRLNDTELGSVFSFLQTRYSI